MRWQWKTVSSNFIISSYYMSIMNGIIKAKTCDCSGLAVTIIICSITWILFIKFLPNLGRVFLGMFLLYAWQPPYMTCILPYQNMNCHKMELCAYFCTNFTPIVGLLILDNYTTWLTWGSNVNMAVSSSSSFKDRIIIFKLEYWNNII